jgi:hypothetical protein
LEGAGCKWLRVCTVMVMNKKFVVCTAWRNLEKNALVFALMVTEPAASPSNPTSRYRNNLCKDDSALFSRFLYGDGFNPTGIVHLPSKFYTFTSMFRIQRPIPQGLKTNKTK